jgi:hypothetical protein
MKRLLILVGISVLVFASVSVSLAATRPAITSLTYSAGNLIESPTPGTDGWRFQVVNQIVLKSLGLFDAGNDGLSTAYDHSVAIYAADGSIPPAAPVASAVIGQGTTATLSGGFRWAPIADVTLNPGWYRIGANYDAAPGDDQLAVSTTGVPLSMSVDPAVSVTPSNMAVYLTDLLGGDVYYPDTINTSWVYGFLGPNFMFDDMQTVVTVPEPATWMLFGLGFAGFLLRARKRTA